MMFLKTHAAGMFLAAALFQGPASELKFEVASIKPAEPIPVQIATGRTHIGMKVDGARVDIGSAPLSLLIQYAYHVNGYQVSIPEPLNRTIFDVLAKIPDGATPDQVPAMLQALLADRFKLVFHREQKEVAIYELVAAKGVAKLKASDPAWQPAEKTGVRLPDGSAFAQTGQGTQVRMSPLGGGGLRVESSHMDMAGLVDMLRRFVDRPVVDMTGVSGYYQIAFETSLFSGPRVGAPPPPESDPGPGLIFASIEKLGLRLEARKGPVETIVVDSAEKDPPTD